MKQQLYQQFVYKIHSGRILGVKRKSLVITPKDARLNDEIISLADSNVLRNIDRLNGVDRAAVAQQVDGIRKRISFLQKLTENKVIVRNEIRKLYAQLDELQFKDDYIMVVMDKPSDFDKLNKGFKINGIEFKRLVGTSNGVKKSTVVYCSVVNGNGVHIHDELERALNGGRDESKEIVPAKFEAYKSLACSASIEVSKPLDILVVDDFVLKFNDDIIRIENNETMDEPSMEKMNAEVELNASDGFGLMLPSLAERWSKELGLDYTASGMCIRNLFCKGMVFTFDFKEFANRYYNSDTIADVWGTVRKIENIELILPVSVMKLWDSYDNLEHYLKCCDEFHHTFAVTKTCEKELENERTLNYQFIQSYELTDDDIMELISPTINEIKETIVDDADKTLLFLRGACGKNYNFNKDTNYLAKAIMVNPEVAKDPYVISTVGNMISKKIKELKIGKCKVHGNYTVISSDPFAFCQSIFGCDVPDSEKGLLKAGEMYSKYWADLIQGVSKKVVCFRAPMSCHNNIRVMNVARDDEIDYWYQYMKTVNIINVHDTFYTAENGADNDGDSILTTDNDVLLRKWRRPPAIFCVQKKAQKAVITEENLALSNKNGFGDEIGTITNRITSMYDIKMKFPESSEQYKTLEYRIKCGQLLQQDCIDKIKGIIAKPMPKEWYDIHSVIISDEDDPDTAAAKTKNREIIADKKPYFMVYIYPNLYSEVSRFEKTAQSKCKITFGMSLSELLVKPDKTEREKEFINWYHKKSPVYDNNGVMNRICHIVENEFDGYVATVQKKTSDFSPDLFSSGNVCDVSSKDCKQLVKLYKEYVNDMQNISVFANIERQSPDELYAQKMVLLTEFKRQCNTICPNSEQLCDALLDICYNSNCSKKFAWDICGDQIVRNLLKRSGGYTYFTLDDSGDIVYCGKTYKRNDVDIDKENTSAEDSDE